MIKQKKLTDRKVEKGDLICMIGEGSGLGGGIQLVQFEKYARGKKRFHVQSAVQLSRGISMGDFEIDFIQEADYEVYEKGSKIIENSNVRTLCFFHRSM